MEVTKERKPQSSLSSEAFEMLDCFVAGLDDVVFSLAEQIARERHPGIAHDAPVAVEVEDVKQAARTVIQGVRNAIKGGKLPASFESVVQEMQDCFEERCLK